MKTAMQELHKHFIDAWSSPGDCWNPGKVIDKIESMIEKEKKQIVNDFENGYKSCDLDEALEINKTMFSGEEYYNQAYNQNK